MSSTPHKAPITNLEGKNIIDLVKQGKRIDGRNLMEYRELDIKVGIIEKANGSAQVTLGKTQVIAGVKVEVGAPFPDTPNEGAQTVNAEFTPIAHPTFESGPPGEVAIELARVVDRSIRESNTIDREKLCIDPGKKVFVVFIDLNIMDHDGNLIDASTIAALVALLTSKINKYELKDGELIYKSELKPLPINDCPIAMTFAKLDETLVMDPCLKEEETMKSRLTIGVNKKGSICAMQKGGIGEFSIDEIEKAIKAAMERSQELRSKISEVIKNA